MGKKKSLQHVQVPHDVCLDKSLEMEDRLIYANVKRHMNGQNGAAFPSMDTLKEKTGLSKPVISAGLWRMKDKHLNWFLNGRKRYYTFPQSQNRFEPFSFQFLDKEDLTPQEKAYLICLQPLMFKDVKGLGKTSYTVKDLSNILNIPESSIYRYEQSLKNKGYLTTIKTRRVDPETGIHLTERVFNMDMLDQMIIWRLRSRKEVQANTNEEVAKLRKEQKMLTKALNEAMKKNALLKDELKIVL